MHPPSAPPFCTALLHTPSAHPCCTPLLHSLYAHPHRHEPDKPFVEFTLTVSARCQSLRSHSPKGRLSRCTSREDWIEKIREVGLLNVPGSWWPGCSSQEKVQSYKCVFAKIEYSPSGQYTFLIQLTSTKGDSSKYPMVWSDVQRFWIAKVPLHMYTESSPPGIIDLVSGQYYNMQGVSKLSGCAKR